MTTKQLQELYYEWLLKKVAVEYGNATERTYHGLFRKLHEREFAWTIANDKNRAHDGLDLRLYFRREHGLQDGDMPGVDVKGVSVLEVIIGLSVRLAFLAEGAEEMWAWALIENIGLSKMWDPITPKKDRAIDEALEVLLFRTYNHDGTGGGFFPLAWPTQDQREVELWYQMSAYVLEMHEP